jgi:hypothetical protein
LSFKTEMTVPFTTTLLSPTRTKSTASDASIIIKTRQVKELHLESKYFSDPATGIKHHLTNQLFKYDREIKAMPLAFSAGKLAVVGVTGFYYDNPQMHITVKIPWILFCPQLGVKLSAMLTSQSDFDGLRLLLELEYPVEDPAKKKATCNINVIIPRDRVSKVCKWEDGCFVRRKSKYTQVPEKLRAGMRVDFWVIGHTCDPDGANYALHGTLYNKEK